MSTKSSDQHAHLIDKVVALIKDKLPAKQSALVADFARRIFNSIAYEDLAARATNDLYGSALSLWNFIQGRKPGETKLRVINPEFAQHGWQSPHTVIELIHDDMPFLVDSINMEINRLGLSTHLFIHVPTKIVRDAKGMVTSIHGSREDVKGAVFETPMFLEIDRQTDAATIAAIEKGLMTVLADVEAAVGDWKPMCKRLEEIIAEVKSVKSKLPMDKENIDESIAFLEWMQANNFTFLGYRTYESVKHAKDWELAAVPGSSLGLMRHTEGTEKKRLLSGMTKAAQGLALNNTRLLVLSKTNAVSTVHRPARIDYIGVKRFNDKGEVAGEYRFLGLFTSAAYNTSARQIPLLRHKVQTILDRSGLAPNGHDSKALLNILETFPRDELIQIGINQLVEMSMGILHIAERPLTRLFVRPDAYGRFFSCLVYTPRDRYTTRMRLKMQAILKKAFGSEHEVDFTTQFSESVLTRIHFVVRVKNTDAVHYDARQIEQELIDATRSWEDNLSDAMVVAFGEGEGKKLYNQYVEAFPPGYKDEMSVQSAALDVKHMESLSETNRLGMMLYRSQEDLDTQVRLKLYNLNEPLALSDVLPMLENMGLKVINEHPYEVEFKNGKTIWVLDFSMAAVNGQPLDLDAVKDIFQECFARVWANDADNDGFNRLTLLAKLNWREVSILRALAKYMRQLGFTYSQQYIEETLGAYPHIAQMLVQLFNLKFNPKDLRDLAKLNITSDAIYEALEKVKSLDQDRILRRYLDIMAATVRTNFFQKDGKGKDKPYISFKIRPREIPEVPQPTPLFEIWVFSPRVEGVHLRFGMVARGGLRWSDRREDFRTEVLGLVKAQQVKNTVIVPMGAKGGFVCKQMPTGADRKRIQEEGIACYQTFIKGLLDITDNIVAGKIQPPRDVYRHDEDDPYLVVAADKGTATFSDIANAISLEYNHWLGDAFASGGSNGYDHKGMGITAKGGWESVKRHFREMGIDCQTTDFTCVGIGDMAGDVFGNGMLLSKHTRLIAAFNHLHIFIDPNPNAAKSFEERQRLFNLPGSSWTDYNTKLISKGGGIFLRSEKEIKLSPEIRALIGTDKAAMAPNELMKTLLKADYDLLWNGGIGTYVKSSKETHADVGDRANDALRVNGNELRCKVIGEGGNLGCTQLGRVEFALKGGRLNTDFIDNVGGVDCSDNEVNIKILLNELVAGGDMTMKQRNELLAQMTDAVGDIVIEDCYQQSQSISITETRAPAMVKEHMRFIHWLEKLGILDRGLEFLPSDEEMLERRAQGRGLTRPELSILSAYGKMVLKQALLDPAIGGNPYFSQLLVNNFPVQLQKRYTDAMQRHRLRGEIIANQLANEIVNLMGCNFVHRLIDETGHNGAEIAICYTVAKEIFGVPALFDAIEALDNKVPAGLQLEVMYQAQRLMRRSVRWFLRHRDRSLSIEQSVAIYRGGVAELEAKIASTLEKGEAAELEAYAAELVNKGLPKAVASKVAYLSTLFSGLDIVEVARQSGESVPLVAEVYYKLGYKLELHWFLEQINAQPVDNHWQAFARAAFREELDWQQRALAAAVMRMTEGKAEQRIQSWTEGNAAIIHRWAQMAADFRSTAVHEFAKFSVALRELLILVQSCSAVAESLAKPAAKAETAKLEIKAAPKATTPKVELVKAKTAKLAAVKKPAKAEVKPAKTELKKAAKPKAKA
ncbi:MAG: NAD-glutamate dehydrogenase [Gammaproteobacteria bacterium]|nr:NAD-glutamate dehydrogenase [Gammaproteobacteria bacterium]